MEVWIHEIADDAAEVLERLAGRYTAFLQINSDNPDALFHRELNWRPWEIFVALHALEEEKGKPES